MFSGAGDRFELAVSSVTGRRFNRSYTANVTQYTYLPFLTSLKLSPLS